MLAARLPWRSRRTGEDWKACKKWGRPCIFRQVHGGDLHLPLRALHCVAVGELVRLSETLAPFVKAFLIKLFPLLLAEACCLLCKRAPKRPGWHWKVQTSPNLLWDRIAGFSISARIHAAIAPQCRPSANFSRELREGFMEGRH